MQTKRKIKGTKNASPEQRRAELIEAAKICFGRNGYNSTSIDDIAAQAGLSKGSVYRFFPAKDDILLAILDQYEARFIKKFQEIRHQPSTSVERIRLCVCALITMCSDQLRLERVWAEFQNHECARSRFSELLATARQAFGSLLEEGVAAREIKDLPPQQMVDLILIQCEGLLSLAALDDSFDPFETFEKIWPYIAPVFVADSC